MKILYTKKFKEDLGRPWKRLSLGKVKLRGGTDTGLTEDSDLSVEISSDHFVKSSQSTLKDYESEFVRYKDGLQAFVSFPPADASFFTEDFYYQVVLFFYTDENLGEESLAFILYGDTDIDENNSIYFTNLKLTSIKNIITIPKLSWKCDLNLGQSNLTSFLEDPWGNGNVSGVLGKEKMTSLESWKLWTVDLMSTEGDTNWLETTYLNKFGIKIF